MKTEELKSKGLTQEQIDFVMAENGKDLKALQEENKTLTADRDDWQKKAETAEGSLESVKGQLKDAKETLKGFDGVDVEGFKKKISELEERATKAEKDYADKIAKRDFEDILKSAIADVKGRNEKAIRANLDIESLMNSKNQKEDVRKALDALKGAEDTAFMFIDEEAEAAKKAEEEAKQKAAGSAPKFTTQSEPKREPAAETKSVPKIW